MRLPPQEYLQECFDYDPETGELRWKERPLDHFNSERGWRAFNSRLPGKPALACPSEWGLFIGNITYEGKVQSCYQHLVIWKMVTGEEPTENVNHRDGNHTNNRWNNLRLATFMQSQAASKLRRDSRVRVKGVHKCGNKYRADIRHQGNTYYLGTFDTTELASAAYAAKAQELYGEFARA